MYSSNFPQFSKLSNETYRNEFVPFSWFRRATVIKMNILPIRLYSLLNLTIKIPATFFSSYRQICTDFIWYSKELRLGWDKLRTPKQKGGIGIPNLRTYYWACQLTRVIDWHAWVWIEDSFSLLRHLPWIESNLTPKQSSNHPTIGPTLLNFQSSSSGLLTPINHSPDCSPGLASNPFCNPDPELSLSTKSFFDKDTLLPYNALISHFPDRPIPFHTYLQIRHVLNSSKPLTSWHRDLTPLETLW